MSDFNGASTVRAAKAKFSSSSSTSAYSSTRTARAVGTARTVRSSDSGPIQPSSPPTLADLASEHGKRHDYRAPELPLARPTSPHHHNDVFAVDRSVNRENRELLLLGENARLREKLNRVIDEAEDSVSELMQANATVKDHYVQKEIALAHELNVMTANCEGYRTLSEVTEADLQNHCHDIKDMVRFIDQTQYQTQSQNSGSASDRDRDRKDSSRNGSSCSNEHSNWEKLLADLAELEDKFLAQKKERLHKSEEARLSTYDRLEKQTQTKYGGTGSFSIDDLNSSTDMYPSSPTDEGKSASAIGSSIKASTTSAVNPATCDIDTSTLEHTQNVKKLLKDLYELEQHVSASRRETIAALQQIEALYLAHDDKRPISFAETNRAKVLLETIRTSGPFVSQHQQQRQSYNSASSAAYDASGAIPKPSSTYSSTTSNNVGRHSHSQPWDHDESEHALSQAVDIAKAALVSSKAETKAMLILLESLAEVQGPRKVTSKQHEHERQMMETIKGSMESHVSSRSGMHPTYRAVPYKQRFQQIQADRSALRAQFAEEDDNDEQASQQDKSYLPAYLVNSAVSDDYVKRGKSTKSNSIELVPKGLNLMATPVRKQLQHQYQHDPSNPSKPTAFSPDASGASEGTSADNTAKLHLYHTNSDNNANSNTNHDGNAFESTSLDDEMHYLSARSELETLWQARVPLTNTSSSAYYKHDASDIDNDFDEMAKREAPKTLADMMLYLTDKVSEDLCRLRNEKDHVAKAREHMTEETKVMREEFAAEVGRLRSSLHECNDELKSLRIKCNTAIEAKEKLQNTLNHEVEQERSMEGRLEATIAKLRENIKEVNSEFKDAEFDWHTTETQLINQVATIRKELGERSTKHAEVKKALESRIVKIEADGEKKRIRTEKDHEATVHRITTDAEKVREDIAHKYFEERKVHAHLKVAHANLLEKHGDECEAHMELQKEHAASVTNWEKKAHDHSEGQTKMQRAWDSKEFSFRKNADHNASVIDALHIELKSAQNDLKANVDEYESFKYEVRHSREAYEALRIQVTEYEEWAPRIESDLAAAEKALQEACERHDDDGNSWDAATEDYEAQISTLKQQLQKKTNQEHNFQSQVARLELDLKSSNGEVLTERTAHEHAIALVAEHERVVDQVEKLNIKLSKAKEVENDLIHKLENSTADDRVLKLTISLQELTSNLTKEKSARKEAEVIESAIKEDLQVACSQYEAQQTKMHHMEQDAKNDRARHAEQMQAANNEIEKINDKLHDVTRELEGTATRERALLSKRQAASDDSRRHSAEIAKLHKEIKEEKRLKGLAIEKATAAEKSSKLELNGIRHEFGSYKVEAEESRMTISALEKELEAARVHTHAHREEAAHLEPLRKNLAELEQENETLHKTHQAHKDTALDLEQVKAKLEEAEDLLAKKEATIVEYYAIIATFKKKEDMVEEIANQEHSELQLLLETEMQKASSDIAAVEAELSDVTSELYEERKLHKVTTHRACTAEQAQLLLTQETTKMQKLHSIALAKCRKDVSSDAAEERAFAEQKWMKTQQQQNSRLERAYEQTAQDVATKHARAITDLQRQHATLLQQQQDRQLEHLHKNNKEHSEKLMHLQNELNSSRNEASAAKAAAVAAVEATEQARQTLKTAGEGPQALLDEARALHASELHSLKEALHMRVQAHEEDRLTFTADTATLRKRAIDSDSARLSAEQTLTENISLLSEKEQEIVHLTSDSSAQRREASKAISDYTLQCDLVAQQEKEIKDLKETEAQRSLAARQDAASSLEMLENMRCSLQESMVQQEQNFACEIAVAREECSRAKQEVETLRNELNGAMQSKEGVTVNCQELRKKLSEEKKECTKWRLSAEESKKASIKQYRASEQRVAELKASESVLTSKVASLEGQLFSAHNAMAENNEIKQHLEGRYQSLQKVYADKLSKEKEEELKKRRLQGKVHSLQGDLHMLHELQDMPQHHGNLPAHLSSRAHATESNSRSAATTPRTGSNRSSPASSPKKSPGKRVGCNVSGSGAGGLPRSRGSSIGSFHDDASASIAAARSSPPSGPSEREMQLEGDVRALQEKLRDAESAKIDADARLESSRESTEARITTLKKHSESLQVKYEEQLQKQRQSYSDLQGELAIITSKAERSQAQVKDLNNQIADLQDMLRVTPIKIQGEVSEMQSKIAATEIANKRSHTREVALEEQLSLAQRDLRELTRQHSQLNKKLAEYTKNLSEQETEIITLKQQLQQSHDETEKTSKDLMNLQADVNGRKDVKKLLITSQESCESLASELAKCKHELKITTIKLNLQLQQVKDADMKLSEVRQKVITSEQLLENAEVQITLQSADIKGAATRLKAQAEAHTEAMLAQQERHRRELREMQREKEEDE